MRVFVALIALAVALAGLPAGALQAEGPSFDCAVAVTDVEVAICGDAELAAADLLMARLYTVALTSAFDRGPSNQPARQREWLADRERECRSAHSARRVPCLQEIYDARNVELAVAVLFREPELALATLHRLNPYGAPLLEAVYLFASEPPGTNWDSPALATKRERLIGLLGPFASRFDYDERLVYGRDILADDGIVTARDALMSEAAFANFVQVTSAYLEGDVVQQVFPCAAIVRHPDLLGATGPVFGSTLDNFVFMADCRDTLPPAPRFARLVDRIWLGWPECQGTIRFAHYRGFASEVNRALLATGASVADSQVEAMPRVRLVQPAQVDAAIAELAAYYVSHGRATPSQSTALARIMVSRVLESAHTCD